MAYLSPVCNEPMVDANGSPLSGGKVFTYLAGTSTPATTYADADGLVPQTNPIILNARGVPANPIWLGAGVALKLIVTDANDVALAPTYDDILGINDPSGALQPEQWLTFTGTATYIGATSFSVAGDQTPIFQIGRRLKSSNSGGTIYSTISNSAFAAGITTVTVVNDSGTLDAGLATVYYGILSPDNPSVPYFTAAITQRETAARSWTLKTRSVVTTFPVPTFRPETANTTMSVDVMPNGTPAESVGNGYAWFDVCNADVRDNNNAVWAARLAATSTVNRVASISFNGAAAKPLSFAIGTSDKWYIDHTNFQLSPGVDNGYDLGSGGIRARTIYAGTGAINTSDRREKQDIAPITDAVLDAWAEVEFCTYRWKAAVQEKGDAARVHIGLIAQDILDAFTRHGLDARQYGLFCYDEWTSTYEPGEHGEMTEVAKNGNRYGIRPDQCLFLEAALMRRELKRLRK